MRFYCWFLVFGLQPLYAQQFDYLRDESPVISWNQASPVDPGRSAGGIDLWASPAFAAMANPALTPEATGIHGGLSLQVVRHGAFQYRGLNQGVLRLPGGGEERLVEPGALGLVLPTGRVQLALGYYNLSLQGKPDWNATTLDDDEDVTYASEGTFEGREDALFVATSLPLGQNMQVGARLDYVQGERQIDTRETRAGIGAFILDEDHEWEYLSASLGLLWDLSQRSRLAASVELPFADEVDRQIQQSFLPTDGNSQAITGSASDPLERPNRLNLSSEYHLKRYENQSPRLILGGQLEHNQWSDYRYISFGETIPRQLDDQTVFAVGLKYIARSNARWRLGYRHDPQPVAEPDVSLQTLSLGVDFSWRGFDIASAVAYSFASAEPWDPDFLTLTYSISYGRIK